MTIDYSKIKYNPLNPIFAQEGLEKIMKVLKDFPIWLDYGTLLGAVREKKFMKHDYDVDLGVTSEYTDEIYTHKKELADMGVLMASSVSHKVLHMFNLLYKNIKIDLYVWHKRKDTYRKARFFHNGIWIFAEINSKHYSNLDTIEFLGKQYYIPSYVEEHLETMYGDWKTPMIYSTGEGRIEKRGKEF